MTTPVTDSSTPATPAPRALEALAAVIAEFNANRPLETSVAVALETLRQALGAEECSLWLYTADGLVRAAGAGPGQVTQQAVDAALDGGPEMGVRAVRVTAFDRRVGALALRPGHREPRPDDTTLLTAVANLLAPALVQDERSRQLEVEVASRTAEIDRERRFTEKIIDSLPVGMYVIDRAYRVQAWNRKRETGMQGVSRDEAIGRTIFDILHRQPADRLRREFDEVFATGRIHEYQIESSAGGATARTFRITKIPMRLGDSAVTHVITIGEDVTDWHEGQQRFAQADKLAAIGTLAAGVMHEINNPLATIAACAEGLGYHVHDLEQQGVVVKQDLFDYLKIVEHEVERCKQIVDQLLAFSGPRPQAKSPVDLNEVVEQTLFLMKHHHRFRRMTLHRELDPSLPAVAAGNAEQLVQVLMALMINAADATAEGGVITVRTHRGAVVEEGAVVEVSDTGHGIARGEISKIFEPFYTTKSAGEGTGLGLAICYGIVQDHHGRIDVESTVGKGSTFRVLLPSVAW